MNLTPEQKQAVESWVAAGDNLSTVQKKLAEQFKLNLTYRDVRFLVDDLNLVLKDAAPRVDASDLSRSPAPAGPGRDAPVGKAASSPESAEALEDDLAEEDLAAGGAVRIEVDKVSLIPGALASGSVTFSDGVTGKWVIDQYGRPGFTQMSKPNYRPSAADSQAFVQELSQQLQKRGF